MLATQASGQWHFLLKDHLGSTRVVTDENNLIAAHYQYSAFGEVMRSAESEAFAYRFTGQEYDEETGLHNYKARLYDSELGRFYGIDPAGQYASPYSYVGSNPISYVDPSGEAGFLYALAKAAFTGGLVGAHTAHRNGGDPWKAGLQGALQGGLTAGLGAFAPPGAPGAVYNAGIGSIVGGAISGADPSGFGLSALQSLPGAFAGRFIGDVNQTLAESHQGGIYREPWMKTIVTDEVVVTPDGNYIVSTPVGMREIGGKLWGDVEKLGNPAYLGAVNAMNQWSSVTTEAMLWLTPTPGLGLIGKGLGRLGSAGSKLWRGGKTFNQYKAAYWANRAKPTLDPLINTKTGQVWKQYTELHHRFIPQRAKWAPNWLKNNRLNLKPVSSLKHAQIDPYRARFAPKWVKDMYKLKWK